MILNIKWAFYIIEVQSPQGCRFPPTSSCPPKFIKYLPLFLIVVEWTILAVPMNSIHCNKVCLFSLTRFGGTILLYASQLLMCSILKFAISRHMMTPWTRFGACLKHRVEDCSFFWPHRTYSLLGKINSVHLLWVWHIHNKFLQFWRFCHLKNIYPPSQISKFSQCCQDPPL